MGKISGAHYGQTFDEAPPIQVFGVQGFAGCAGKTRVQVYVGDVLHDKLKKSPVSKNVNGFFH